MWVNAKLVLVSLVNFVATLVNLGDLYPVSVAASTGRLASYLCAVGWQLYYSRRGFVARDGGIFSRWLTLLSMSSDILEG